MSVKVTVTDTETGDTESHVVNNDYIIVTVGSCHVDKFQTYARGTHVLTVKGRTGSVTPIHEPAKTVTDDEVLLNDLWTYTRALERAFSVWHVTRMAPWPAVPNNLFARLIHRLPDSDNNKDTQGAV